MVRPDGRPAQRRALASALAITLAIGGAIAGVPGSATAVPLVDRAAEPDPHSPPVEPTDEPGPTSPPPTVEPPEEPSPPASPSPPPTPGGTTGAPTPSSGPPVTTSPPRPTHSPPGRPPASTLAPPGVRVSTDDLTLPAGYWNAASTVATLQVTITNTGTASAGVRLTYTLPVGLADAGTDGCASAGNRQYRCGQWTAAPGARFSTRLRVRVDGDAWREMPLAGSVRVTATGAAGTARDDEGFAVLFPPGPPVPGITMRAGEVSFAADGASDGLTVSLSNTGRVDAEGRVDVVLPAGVTVPAPPPGCVAAADGRTRCDLGSVPSGRTGQVRLPLAATTEAQLAAPLAGAVIGRLDPRNGAGRQMQLSFRITATPPQETAVVPPPGPVDPPSLRPAGALPDDGDAPISTRRTAVLLIAVSVLLVLLVLGLATASLRRRAAGTGADGRAAAGDGTGAGAPGDTGPAPETGIWFQPRRPARPRDRPGWDVR
ncbi:hypothetical protein SAMN05443287_10564 [Micromonospora phaseoli]|uniref:Uncharacterized protein n=1 Tax=Micromonospora phaseoli TaxID=1144548 RepID=A0A1H6ZF04_9ACTN|nr:hypothetical protein [Micromonospora phaseoli]PZV97239.1 hypothetical protein CLV64_106349 [Micromonospora phaseoli]GIJ77182.1 hypothetical protein Xph01_16140 [Micromonospora phaseoli]SEJ52019.1 hypothetical protein SAMN05443287_10564 [Micromonospora phaseoli]